MRWKAFTPMTERVSLIATLEAGESMSELCRAFGISRMAVFKLLERSRGGRAGALLELIRRRSDPRR